MRSGNGPCVGQENGGFSNHCLPHLPSFCGKKDPGPLQIQAGGCYLPLGSSRERNYCLDLGDLDWEGSPELGVGVGVEEGGVQQWGTLAPCPL
jgi:hypothetical protein